VLRSDLSLPVLTSISEVKLGPVVPALPVEVPGMLELRFAVRRNERLERGLRAKLPVTIVTLDLFLQQVRL